MIRVLTSFRAALAQLRRRKAMPTSLGSAEIRALARNVRSGAIFSARTTQARVIEELREQLDAMLAGQANLADAMLRMRGIYAEMGYTPEGGFPQDEPGTAPPAEAGTLRDLGSAKRRRLVITTNYRMLANAAYIEQGSTPDALRQFPALELVRIGARRVPRGKKMTKAGLEDDPGQDWPSRWIAAGGEIILGRMMALKGADVWQQLGDGAGGYDDTLGNPFPPFAFNSGYGVREASRAEALEMGVLEEGGEAARMDADLAATLRTAGAGLSDETVKLFQKTLKKEAKTGRVSLADKIKAEAAQALAGYRRGS